MQEPPTIATDISARISFSGALEAQCILEFPSASAQRLTDTLLGHSEVAWDDSMVADAVGELCNMIAGGLKMRLGEPASGASVSLPLLSSGSGQSIPGVCAITMRRVYSFDESEFAVLMTMFQEHV